MFLGPIHEGLRNELSKKRDEYAGRLLDSTRSWKDVTGNNLTGMEAKHRENESYRLLFYKFFVLCAAINSPQNAPINIKSVSLDLIRQFDGFFDKRRYIRACRVIKSYIEGRCPLDTTLIHTVTN